MNNLQTQMDNFADNYPDLKTVMQNEGLMDANGRIIPDKFIDQDYLDALEDRIGEAETKQIGALLKNARVTQATRGVQGGLQNVGLASQMNEAQRGLNRQFGDAYKQESDRATGLTLNMGQQYQGDAINQNTAKMNALLNDVARKKETMDAQGEGLLQSPEGMAALAQMAVGAATGNPAMAANGLGQAAGTATGSNSEGGGRIAPGIGGTGIIQRGPIDVSTNFAGSITNMIDWDKFDPNDPRSRAIFSQVEKENKGLGVDTNKVRWNARNR